MTSLLRKDVFNYESGGNRNWNGLFRSVNPGRPADFRALRCFSALLLEETLDLSVFVIQSGLIRSSS